MNKPIAVITGASGGLGSASIAEFARSGYWTIGVDIEKSSAADEHLTIDLARPSCGEEIALALGERVVSVLVNNAAIGADSLLLETTVEAWDRLMAVNLRAPLLAARALYGSLAAGGDGSIVNVGSVHALASSPGVGTYAASKGGLLGLTRAMALEWAPEIRANCVLPGAVDTPMLRHGFARTSQTVEDLAARHPLGRLAQPSDIARVVRFVATEAGFMTGSAVVVDGGVLSHLSSE